MKSKLIFGPEEEKPRTFSFCLQETGIYKKETEYQNSEHLVVVSTSPHPVYFGIYSGGEIFQHVDDSECPDNDYYKIGDIEVIVKVLEPNQPRHDK